MGLELLEPEDVEKLNEIKYSHQRDASEGCKQMLQMWLERCPDAMWKDLIRALHEIGLKSLALRIHLMLRNTEGTVYTHLYVAMLLWNIALLRS